MHMFLLANHKIFARMPECQNFARIPELPECQNGRIPEFCQNARIARISIISVKASHKHNLKNSKITQK